jgi:hypothetical protein
MGGQDAGNGVWAPFRRDLGQAAGVLVSDPLLLALTAVLTGGAVALDRLGHWWTAPALALDLFLMGFAGTQRVWFLRGFRDRSLKLAEIWPMTLRFIPRFLLLGLVTGGSFLTVLFVLRGVGIVRISASRAAGHAAHRPLGLVIIGACLVADVALTFVTPALALSFRSWRQALRRGFRALQETWPSSAFYVLTPGITLFAVSALAPKSADGAVATALAAASGAVLALWFKGAVVAFYSRLYPSINDSGAAYADEPARPRRKRA